MNKTIEAVWENGVFRPLDASEVPVGEGERVQLAVAASPTPPVEEILTLAAQVYEGLSDAEVAEIERIALQRSEFFTARGK